MNTAMEGRPAGTGSGSAWRKRAWILVIAACLFHLPALWCDFLSDDMSLVVHNERLDSSGFVRDAFRRDYGLEFGETRPKGYYRPILMVADYALHHLCGPSRAGYRLLGIAVLAANGLLIRRLLCRSPGGAGCWLATLAAAVYVANPTRTEPVVCFMSLPDLLSELWLLLAVSLLMRWAGERAPGQRLPLSPLRWAGLLGLGFLTVTTKESGLVMAATLAGATLFFAMWRPFRALLSAGALAFSAGAGLGMWLRASAGIEVPLAAGSWKLLFTDWPKAWLQVIALDVWHILIPAPAVFYREFQPAAPSQAAGLAAAGVLCAVAALALVLWRRRNYLGLVLAGTTFGALILQGLILVHHLPYSERYMPTAILLMGLTLGGSALGAYLMRLEGMRFARRISLSAQPRLWNAIAAMYIFWQGSQTLASTFTCLTPTSFFTAMAEANPDAAYPRLCLAGAMYHAFADFDAMDRHLHAALERAHDARTVKVAAELDISRHLVLKRYDRALAAADGAIAQFPADAELHSLKALALCYLGRKEEALACIQSAVAFNPHEPRYRTQHQRIRDGTIGPGKEPQAELK